MTAIESTAVEIDFTSLCEKREHPHLQCQCGCADADPSKVVGWCLWCGHGYVEYSTKIEDQHFAYHCPEPPEKLKQAAWRAWQNATRKPRWGPMQIGRPLKTIVVGPLELPVVPSPAIEAPYTRWRVQAKMHQTGDCVAFSRNPGTQTKALRNQTRSQHCT